MTEGRVLSTKKARDLELKTKGIVLSNPKAVDHDIIIEYEYYVDGKPYTNSQKIDERRRQDIFVGVDKVVVHHSGNKPGRSRLNPVDIKFLVVTFSVISLVLFTGAAFILLPNNVMERKLVAVEREFAAESELESEFASCNATVTGFMQAAAIGDVDGAFQFLEPIRMKGEIETTGSYIRNSSITLRGFKKVSNNWYEYTSIGAGTWIDVRGYIVYSDGSRLPYEANCRPNGSIWKIRRLQLGDKEPWFKK